jgi:hypothetical protein
MRKNPDVRNSHIVCAEVFIKYSSGDYRHYAQTATIGLSGIQAYLDIGLFLSYFFGGACILYDRTQCRHIFYLVKIDVDSHNAIESGQQ